MPTMHRISRSMAALGGLVVVAALLGTPSAVGASTTRTPDSSAVAADLGTVTVSVTLVGFTGAINIYSFDNVHTAWCEPATSCSLDVPSGTPMAVKVIAHAPYAWTCPTGSNTDGPVLDPDGLWYGWCGDSSPFVPTENVTVIATATTSAPVKAMIDTLPTWTPSTGIALEWGGIDGNWLVTSFDVRYRRAAWNGGFGTYATWKSGTTAEFGTFTASPGATYCFSVRANDSHSGHSAWTSESCTAVPLDDRSLTRSSGWTAATGSAYYRGTALRATAVGTKLTRTGVVAKRIALLATTCPTCGTVKVYLGSTLLKTVSLISKTTVNQRLMTVATFSAAQSGTLVIKVSSSGKRVVIDGVAIRRN